MSAIFFDLGILVILGIPDILNHRGSPLWTGFG